MGHYTLPGFAPFIEHSLQCVVIDDAGCDSEQAFVVLRPDRRHVSARCPLNGEEHGHGFHEVSAPLY